MKWTVLFTPSAEQELAAVWMESINRNAITAAANQVETLLATAPTALGEVKFDTVRTVGFPPLGVEFEVVEAHALVWVLSVWDISNGSGH